MGEVVEGTAHLKTEIDRARSVFWAFFLIFATIVNSTVTFDLRHGSLV